MTAHPFTVAFRKVERAEKHVKDLHALISGFLDRGDIYEVVPEFKDNGDTDYVFRVRVEIPGDVPLILGDAIHNLRSALDHAVCSLVVHNGKKVEKWHGFPIFGDTAPDCHEAGIRHAVDGAGDAAFKIVAGEEPYKGANNPLWGLHKLDIDDKHKFIVPTFSLSKIICEGISYDRLHPQPDKDIVKGGSFLHIVIDGVDHIVIGGKRLKDGDIVTTVLGPEISNYQINIKTNIAIHEPGVGKSETIFPWLEIVLEQVEGIVRKLSGAVT